MSASDSEPDELLTRRASAKTSVKMSVEDGDTDAFSSVLLLAVLREMSPAWPQQQHYRARHGSQDSLFRPQTFLGGALDPPLPLRYFSTECPPCCLRDHEEYTVTEGMTFKTVILERKCISRSQGND
ncbi:hypothetical protein EYF80_039828 [Liparis tanakae]|uniref:Uncharacterized protein n=1 Tax=Liparis tanakae TaxID=230148 RepID=A0A4Z2G9Q9_9TELE|nr:hypothetical protein EYF80_039828 [Liparis tanakae]